MKPLVIDYLRTHSFRQLEEDHGVCVRFSVDGTKASLNYDQLLAKSGDPVAEQCRGMVIRPTQFNMFHFGENWKHAIVGEVDVLAWPMCRFYNHGDGAAADIDWSSPYLRVYEKVDGTCIICYWDPLHGKWHAGTRSVPEADLPINSNNLEIGDMTFSQLFLKALIETREELSGAPVDWVVDGPDKVVHLNKEVTYVFELVSPHNQIVVNYPAPRVYLLAARHTRTGQELVPEAISLEHVRRPKMWDIRNVSALAAFVDTANPMELEGAVACVQVGQSFQRLKVKNKSYVLAHKSKDVLTASPRNMLQAIILETVDDILPLLPSDDLRSKVLAMKDSYAAYCKSIDDNVARFRDEADNNRKRYAEQVMLSKDWTAPYFNLWENRARNAHEWIKTTCEKSRLSDGSLDTILSRLV